MPPDPIIHSASPMPPSHQHDAVEDFASDTSPAVGDTKARLLAAACDEFAEHGFRNATIRDICARADANIAAVNYHFGDKEGLYVAALRFAYQAALDRHPAVPSATAEVPAEAQVISVTPERVLRDFVRNLLHRMLEAGEVGGRGAGGGCEARRGWHARMLSREMIEPTRALDELVRTSFRPQADMIEQCIAELLGPRASVDLVRYAARSMFGQAFLYKHGRPVVERVYPEFDYSPESIDRAAEHIASFTLAALRALRTQLEAADATEPSTAYTSGSTL